MIARLGLVVHPRRGLDSALETIRRWTSVRRVAVVQVAAAGQDRSVAEPGDAADCDVIVALGGDGTTLAALRTGAAAGVPVMGVACGSLGALTAVTADGLVGALERLAEGDWTPRALPALIVEADGSPPLTGVNDLVVIRAGAGQVIAEVSVDGDLYVRYAGDGLVVATPLGSSAYTLAAGGPVPAPGGSGIVFTPLSPHGGCCPPLVAGAESRLDVELSPAHWGARIEIDGQIQQNVEPHVPRSLGVELRSGQATLVMLGGEEPMLAGLRRRRVIIDSPRVLARDAREAAPDPAAEPETG